MRVETFYSKPHASWAWVLLNDNDEQVDGGWMATEELAKMRGAEALAAALAAALAEDA